jgi:Holliday junction resolvasome RuvABC endonuclease subunit
VKIWQDRPVAGLDLSQTSAGVAVLWPNKRAEMTCFGYPLPRKTRRSDYLERYVRLCGQIIKYMKDRDVGYVAIESYAFGTRQIQTLVQAAEFCGLVSTQIFLAMKVVPPLIPASSIRSFLGPNIRDKIGVRRYLESLGYNFRKDDESDALAIAMVVHSWLHERGLATRDTQIDLLDRLDREFGRVDWRADASDESVPGKRLGAPAMHQRTNRPIKR